jgi:hypothetical protein
MKLRMANYDEALTILRERTADVVFYPGNESPWLYGDYALRLEGVGTAYVLCLPEHEDQLAKLPRLRKIDTVEGFPRFYFPQRWRIPLDDLAQAYEFGDIIVIVVAAYLNEFLG